MSRRAVRLLAVTATGALAVAAGPSPLPPAFERPIEVAAPGRVFVRLREGGAELPVSRAYAQRFKQM